MVALLVGIVLSCGGISGDELGCENAVSHLEDCCSTLEGHRFTCERTCRGDVDLTETASECISDRSCTELQDRGICAAMTRLANEPYPASATAAIEQEACK